MDLLEQLFAAPVAATILVITILTSIKAFQDGELRARFILNAYQTFQRREWYRLFTSGLIHSGWWHLAFNMIAYYFFALPLERHLLGPWRFALLYILSLAISGLPAVWRHRDHPHYNALGASGAVSAVVLSVIMFVPDIGIGLLFLPFSIPGWLFAILYMGFSFYAGLKQWGNIGHEAHLFGALAGIVLTILMEPTVASNFLTWLGG